MAAGTNGERSAEKTFYLAEFRGRTLAVAAPARELASAQSLETLLAELAENATRVVLLSDGRAPLEKLAGVPAVRAAERRFEGAVWRAFARRPHVGVWVEEGARFAAAAREIALRLGLGKLVFLDPAGGLARPDGTRSSFVDRAELGRLLAGGGSGLAAERRALLVEVEGALDAGVAAVNLCALEGLADELFSYAGSGTLFTRERYVRVRALGLDDYDAAHALVGRGVAEGYLAARTPEEIEEVLAAGFGAFVDGTHLAGIGALLEHPEDGAGEIACLYTITRFLGEGIGGHLVRATLERARERGYRCVFACTTAERVVRFFQREGFRRVPQEQVPVGKWRDYDAARRAQVTCLLHDLG